MVLSICSAVISTGGQDLLYLNSISEHEYSKPLHLAYVGSFGPQFAGFEECVPVETTNDDGPGALSNNESTLQAGLYAVSRNLIHGSGQSARDGRFGVVKYFSMFTAKQLLNRPSCEIDSAGYSIASFRLPNLGNGSDQPEQ